MGYSREERVVAMIKNRKKIDGRIFYLYQKTAYKDRAETIFSHLKERGYRVRILKRAGPEGYHIYTNRVVGGKR